MANESLNPTKGEDTPTQTVQKIGTNAFVLLASAVSVFGLANALSTGVQRSLEYESNKAVSNRLPNEEALVLQKWKGIIEHQEYLDYMKLQGYDALQSDRYFQATSRNLEPQDLITLNRRGYMTDDEFKLRMQDARVPLGQIENYKHALEFIPPVSDVIRFQVRDVFNPEIVNKYGYDEEFPEAIIKEGSKIGIQEEDLRKYWRAHWELPSLTAAFEMFHRLQDREDDVKTDRETISELLKINDVPKYWRDRLLEISYNLPTRVDIRRFYAEGILKDRTEVLKVYKQLGYDPQTAEWLTQLAEKDREVDTKQLTRSLVEEAYNASQINKEQAVKYLQDLGYSKVDADFIISVDEAKLNDKKVNASIKAYQNLFLKGKISLTGLEQQLSSMQLSPERIKAIIEDTEVKFLDGTKELTKEDTQLLLKSKLIDNIAATRNLLALGYRVEDAENLVKAWTMKAAS